MNITKRLQINLFLSAGVLLVLGLLFSLSLMQQEKARAQGLLAVQIMKGAYELNLISDVYARHPGERPKAQWKLQYELLVVALQRLPPKSTEQDVVINRMREDLSNMNELFTELVMTHDQSALTPTGSGHSADLSSSTAKITQLADLISMRSREVSLDAARLVKDNNAEIEQINRLVTWFPLALTAGLMALVIWYSKFLLKSIVAPLTRLRSGAELVGAGNLDHRIGISSTDELGLLSTAFDSMTERLQVSREELVRTAEQLRFLNDYNRNLIEASLDPFVTIGPDGVITDVNQATEMVTGRNRDELIGTDFADYFTEPERARAGYAQVFREGLVKDYPLAVRHRDGQVTDVLYNAAVYRDQEGQVIGVFAAARDISERKQAEAEREQYFRFFMTSSDLMGMADPNGAFVRTNPAFSATTGYSEAELVSRPFIDFVHPDDKQPTLDEMQRQIAIGQTVKFDNRYICKDGSVRWLSWRAIYKPEENTTYATARDITVNKLQEEALRKSENEFRMLAEAMPQIVWVTRPDGWNIYFNQQWVDYTGLSLEESSGHGWNKPFHPDDQKRAWDAWQNATKNLAAYSLECRLRRADGVYTWWLVRGVPVLNDHGEVLKWFGTCTDIDELKRAEDALRESEDKFKYIFDHSVIGNSITFPSGELNVNDAFLGMLGFNREEFKKQRWQNITHAEDIDLTQRVIDSLVAGEKDSARFVKRYLHKDGSVVWVDLSTSLRRDQKGQPLYLMTSALDITELKKAEAEIHTLNAELEQRVTERTAQLEAANKELEAFSYSVSHDLRAPLRAVDGFSRILLEDYASSLDAEGKRVCAIISESARKMGKLIDDLLAFSRVGRADIQPTTIDMTTMAQSIYFEITTPEERERTDFQVGQLPNVVGDPTLFRQVWRNLLMNAVKFSSKKERPVIEVNAETRGEEIIYSIHDNGAGFDMRYVDKLFGMFQRLHGSKEFEGTGVGLAIVQRIILRHGGRVWCEGEVDKGATFYFAIQQGD